MNADGLLQHYERIADAPDAIARLRRFILELAVRGMLVPQDPKEEPASEMLKRITAETLRRMKSGETRKRDALSEINSKDFPFAIPQCWRWSRLGLLGLTQTGTTPPKTNPQGYGDYIPFIKPGDLYEAHVNYSGPGLSKTGIDESGRLASGGSILMVCIGTIGKCQVIDRSCSFNQQINSLTPIGETSSKFLLLACKSDFFQEAAWNSSAKTTIAILNKGKWEQLPIPIPPLAEQHRIVAKVDELMALCDQLEAARTKREATRDRLAAASLARLNAPDPATFREDARFALDVLPALTARPDQIKQLRQTILNRAVRGKLVPQEPKDEPASELLRRIEQRRSQLLQSAYPNAEEARAQVRKQAEQVVPDCLPTLPSGWAWATLMQCSLLVIDCKNKTAPYAGAGVRLIRTTNVRDGRLNVIDQKFVAHETYANWSARCVPEPGDLLITREAPMGEVCLIPPGEVICLGQRMMLARLVSETIDADFMIYSLRDPNLMERVQDKPIGATVQHLRVGGVETLLVPVPPRAEQHRIVAKVDELMTQCDRLDVSLSSGDSHRHRLLASLLKEALQPAGVLEDVK
jgi:type I restriction enzyme S subunit